jgi:hypothetical protein
MAALTSVGCRSPSGSAQNSVFGHRATACNYVRDVRLTMGSRLVLALLTVTSSREVMRGGLGQGEVYLNAKGADAVGVKAGDTIRILAGRRATPTALGPTCLGPRLGRRPGDRRLGGRPGRHDD